MIAHQTPTAPSRGAAEPVTLHRFTVEDYDRISAAGLLPPDERTELIDGVIVTVAAMNSPHFACIAALNAWITTRIAGRAIVSVQSDLRLGPYFQPLPDLAVMRPRPDRYFDSLPGPGDTLLVVEVADTTYRYDRRVKLPLYAAAGVPEAWIIDLNRRRALIFREPGPDGYAVERVVRRPDGTLTPLAFPDLALPLAEILPPAPAT
jgi:Uma2 family endonuclease